MSTLTVTPDAGVTSPAPGPGRRSGRLGGRQLVAALPQALRKLDPRAQWRNPVMFVVYVGSAFTTALALAEPAWFTWAVALWL